MNSLAPCHARLASVLASLLAVTCATPGPTGSPASDPAPVLDASPDPSVTISHPGCFLLLDLDEDTPLRAGDQPCDEPTIPASTFKIPHALIALDTGVIVDPSVKVPWDGTQYPYMPNWQRDHDLRSAIYESVVWFFQRTAKAIGRERMREYLRAFDYGNASVEGPLDGFWLGGGSLELSPEHSLRFLAALYQNQLTRAGQHLPQLRAMLVRPPSSFRARMAEGSPLPATHPQMIFSAKTGTGRHEQGSVTWLVGHVECPGRALVFVSRVISKEPPQALSGAVTHGLAALDRLGVLQCS